MAEKKGFYFKLAVANVKRSREVYLPYFIAGALISGTFFLILTMIFGNGLKSVPSGGTTEIMFTFGAVIFALFAFLFILYINRFLVSRRKKEFGLYAVLGLSRSHVSRVLMWENLIVMSAAVAAGMILGAALGKLLFMAMLRVMGAATGMSAGYSIPLIAFIGTISAFAITFIVTTALNSIRIGLANTAELLKGDNEGDKQPRSVLPGAITGLVLLVVAYVAAAITAKLETPALAVTCFFPAVALVIVATFLLFSSGSIAFLRFLRSRKQLYYKLDNFVSISGMFHRMRQNSRGLACICILSTMLLVTLAGTVTLYTGREAMLRHRFPTDIGLYFDVEEAAPEFIGEARAIAEKYGVELVSPMDKVNVTDLPAGSFEATNVDVQSMDEVTDLGDAIIIRNLLMIDFEGDDGARVEAAAAIGDAYYANDATQEYAYVLNYFDNRVESNALCGGVLFLGFFFAVLFLAVTVLIIYFKQITEGFEDKRQFEILQQVGMDEAQVKKTINRQIVWVFLLPLAAALLHTFAASDMVSKMLEMFGLYDNTLTLKCTAIVGAVFAVVYLIVYKQTARVYFRIVKR